MEMAEKTVPWWRRALQFALGGIRSGFGLFQRGAKPGEVEAGEAARGGGAGETERARESGGIEGRVAAEEGAIESPLQRAGRTEVEEIARGIPLPGAMAKIDTEAASNLRESEDEAEEIEPAE